MSELNVRQAGEAGTSMYHVSLFALSNERTFISTVGEDAARVIELQHIADDCVQFIAGPDRAARKSLEQLDAECERQSGNGETFR